MNSLTLRELAKETGVNFKTAFRWCYYFIPLVTTVNINALSAIVELDKIFS
ncbi:MAG: hypothetical protein ACTS7E_01750 [Arsenophonus sp. NC-CH8-MAG3]